MKKVGLPLKIAFAAFAVPLIVAAIAFNLGIEKVFYIALVAVAVSAIVMVIIHRKHGI